MKRKNRNRFYDTLSVAMRCIWLGFVAGTVFFFCCYICRPKCWRDVIWCKFCVAKVQKVRVKKHFCLTSSYNLHANSVIINNFPFRSEEAIIFLSLFTMEIACWNDVTYRCNQRLKKNGVIQGCRKVVFG